MLVYSPEPGRGNLIVDDDRWLMYNMQGRLAISNVRNNFNSHVVFHRPFQPY